MLRMCPLRVYDDKIGFLGLVTLMNLHIRDKMPFPISFPMLTGCLSLVEGFHKIYCLWCNCLICSNYFGFYAIWEPQIVNENKEK